MQPYVWFALGLTTAGLAAFFSLIHHALRSYSRTRLEEALQRRGGPTDLERLVRDTPALARSMRGLHLLGLVAMVALLEVWSVERFGQTAVGWLAGVTVAVAFALLFCAVVPTAWATYAPEAVLATTLPVARFFHFLFRPLLRVMLLVEAVVRRLAGVPRPPEALSQIEEEIVSVADAGEREGTLEEEQKDMIENVIKFKRTDASQIMTPRTDIVSIEAAATVEAARKLIAESGFSRIPATGNNLDTIVGILYAKDLLDRIPDRADPPLHVGDVMRKTLFVPETKHLDELLRDFQSNKVHIAVVLDEYGGTAGLVTIEDVVEEIVGEIVDEYEPEPAQPIRRVGERTYQVESRVHIDELNDELKLELPEDEDYETIGGFVLSRLGYIPKAGESLEDDGLLITVLEADERRIVRLRIDVAGPSETADEG